MLQKIVFELTQLKVDFNIIASTHICVTKIQHTFLTVKCYDFPESTLCSLLRVRLVVLQRSSEKARKQVSRESSRIEFDREKSKFKEDYLRSLDEVPYTTSRRLIKVMLIAFFKASF
jgi:hypothetical protein